MKPSSKAIAIGASVVIVLACLVYALARVLPVGFEAGKAIDKAGAAPLANNGRLEIKADICGVTLTADPKAEEVTCRLYGSYSGFAPGGVNLSIEGKEGNVTIRAGRNGLPFFGWSNSLKLDVVIPATFAGDLSVESSAGPVSLNADLAVRSIRAHSSAGPVQARNVKSSGSAELSSSAGPVAAGAIEASDADLHSSAGPVNVESCKAETIKLRSSAGGVTAGALSGKVDASSSAGPVDVKLIEIAGDSEISSSAGGVRVTLPANTEADIEAWTSAGSVSINGLDNFARTTDKRDRIEGKLNGGGARVKAHSSAGPVEIIGR